MGRVVVPVTRLVMAVGKDGQGALRMRGVELRFLPCIVEGMLASVELESMSVLLAADAFSARVTAAAISINYSMIRHLVDTDIMCVLTLRVAVVFAFVLVLFVAAFAFGVVGLGLASTTTMLALLDRTTLRVDMMQLAIYSDTRSAHTLKRQQSQQTWPESWREEIYQYECSRSRGDP
jgi:hypothetical protein